jgi:hypothetical protein
MKQIIYTALIVAFFSCSKNSGESCPEQTYTIECSESYPDFEFSGYLTGTNTYNIQSTCPEDAIKAAAEMSYDYGQLYKHCHVVR